MLTSKQRAHLRGLANTEDTIIQVGKGGVSGTLLTQLDDALKARELVKIKVLDSAPSFAKELADELALETKSEIVQVIGMKIVLFRRNQKDPKISLKATDI